MDKDKEQIITPGLYLVSTPIGNMDDITLRALTILKKSNIILCEDTRRSGKLLSYFQIKNKLMPYHKFNEKKISSTVIDFIKKNKVEAVVLEDIYVTVPKRKKKIIKAVIEYNTPIEAPIAKGDILGSLNIYVAGELKKKIDILSGEEIKKANIFSRLLKSFNFLVWGNV